LEIVAISVGPILYTDLGGFTAVRGESRATVEVRQEAFAIIPARGGSKRIPNKNIREFLGVPILQRIIKVLTESEIFDAIIISTDSDEIAQVAREAGAQVPFLRPANLANDFASTADVALHAIEWLIEHNASPVAEFLVAYPTAVMMTVQQLKDSRFLLKAGYCDLVFAGARFPSEVQRAWWQVDDNFVVPVFPGNQFKRSQDLDAAFFDAGQFYWSTADGWSREVSERGERRKIFEIDPMEAVDINTEEDWQRAEKIFTLLRANPKHQS
jgi:pseudaminic acid cytidylyltransferase